MHPAAEITARQAHMQLQLICQRPIGRAQAQARAGDRRLLALCSIGALPVSRMPRARTSSYT